MPKIKKTSPLPSGIPHSTCRAENMREKRQTSYAGKTKSGKKKEYDDQQKRKRQREEAAGRGPKAKKPKTEIPKTHATNEQSDSSSSSEE